MKVYATSGCTGTPVATGTAAAFSSPGLTVSVADDTTSTFWAMAVGAGNNPSSCSTTSVKYVEDSKAPAPPTFNWAQPASPSAATSLKVAGAAESGSTVRLYTNSGCTGSPVASGSAASFVSPGLAATATENATTHFWAAATDAAGNTSACSSGSLAYRNDAGEMLFEGSKISDFSVLQQCKPGRITEVSDPLGSGRTVMSFSPLPSDVSTNEECDPGAAPTENPRATAISPDFIESGDEFWMRTKLLVPAGYPAIKWPGWNTLVSVYGPPFEGPGPWKVEIKPIEFGGTFYGDFFFHQRNESYEYDIAWWEDLHEGEWVEFLLHEKAATNGFIEEWFNGSQETFFSEGASEYFNPRHEPETPKLEMETLDFSNDGGPNSVRIGQYRQAEEFEPTPIYYEFVKVGPTRSSVED